MILYYLRLYLRFFTPNKLPANAAIILETYNAFFARLDKKSKKRFLKRLSYFYYVMKWETSSDFEIRPSMKILIGSGYIQLTFGLNRYWLRKLYRIHISPQAYNYTYFKTLIIGDVNLALGRITLSWPAVKRGFVIEDDAINVAIHEFAHCLHFEMESGGYSYGLYNNWRTWQSLAVDEILKIRNKEPHIFIDYAGTNELEFFAVAMENFFERPKDFEKALPHLFQATCNLLNQQQTKKLTIASS